ncbi:hydroxymethylglutaryl-CoA reductase [Trebonia kvetii]|uniref:hydroxymethylglutaryl-CoA reductase (NADPH) n=1 Tax=Trebonia kvetii TaxID=2480626 RepID=A0A6P2BXT8_9ACTN|nr:hydroxymethylglutaryl-CoA reductase [Trebonia kvetii]TVZ02003.1 hydroxymethylglutaryl-CoA reductase [Trebonia kvetii]
MTTTTGQRAPIPRLNQDYTRGAGARRLEFLGDATGTRPAHIGRYSIDPAAVVGNVENFIGVAQVPVGIAGPLLVNGEHARGEFYVPLATTEGTLVASYNRGMKLLHHAGGVTTTVMDDRMQRAPAFGFDSAREARAFGQWVTASFDAIKREADATTHTGRLHDIEQFSASRFIFLRFNYTTGDAAGQNMTGKATSRACDWIRDRYPGVRQFCLESNLATDKKNSQINILATRGKRVTAEATIRAGLIREILHTTPEEMFCARQMSNLGGLLSGVNSNGNHSANGIAALFVATGQDIANVAESSAALVHSELLDDGSYYYSITIPALIVATYGGGTGLPTQRECLELLGCYGTGKVLKFAEIVTATVLCGELSLGSAVVAGEWVDAHERLGRNRP